MSRSHTLGRTRRALVSGAAIACAALASTAIASPASADPLEDVTALQLINASRAAVGVCPVIIDINIDVLAKSWALDQGLNGRLAHNLPAFQRGAIYGENVGYGTDVAAVHQLFLNSSTHYANIVNDRITQIGVGVAHVGDRTWVTYDFFGDDRPHRC